MTTTAQRAAVVKMSIDITNLAKYVDFITPSPPQTQKPLKPPKKAETISTHRSKHAKKMLQSGEGSMQGSNEDCLPIRGHTREGTPPQCYQLNGHTEGGDAPTM